MAAKDVPDSRVLIDSVDEREDAFDIYEEIAREESIGTICHFDFTGVVEVQPAK